ncbi:hypothetical protein KCU67_g6698, partial [Aureobasidium melanogenum]
MAENTSLLSMQSSHTSQQTGVNTINKDEVMNSQKSSWRPLFLRLPALLVFAGVYAAMLTSLAIMSWISFKRHGVCAVDVRNRYWWTYGPTAIFTIISLFWGQVDYGARSSMPWILLQRTPARADRTVLLDYVSTNMVSTFLQAFKMLDMLIILSVSGTILNKILVILSTGLFLVDTVTIVSPSVPLFGGMPFSDRGYDASAVTGLSGARVFGFYSLNMSLPFGTTLDYATEVPSLPDNEVPTTTLVSRVGVFYPELECEIAYNTTDVVLEAIGEDMYQYENEDGETVQASGDSSYQVVSGNKTSYSKNPYMVEPSDGGPTAYKLRIASDSCSEFSILGQSQGSLSPDQLLFETPAIKCRNPGFRFVVIAPWSAYLICKPSFTVKEATMNYSSETLINSTAWTLEGIGDANNSKLSNTTGESLYRGFQSSMSVSGDLADLLRAVADLEPSDTLHRPQDLAKTFKTLYVASVAQIANMYLLGAPGYSQVTKIEKSDRLQLQGYALWFTEAILLAMVVSSLFIAWLSRQVRLPRDFSSIAGLATVFAQSRTFLQSFDGFGSASLVDIRRSLESYLFQTVVKCSDDFSGISFEIQKLAETTDDPEIKEPVPTRLKVESHSSWYRPSVLTKKGRVCITFIAIFLVISLAVLQRISDNDNGFVTFINHEFSRYGWKLVPATTFVLLTLAFGSLDAEVKTFQPFANLRNGPAPSATTIEESYLSKVGLHALWIAVRKAQYGIVATTIGVIVSHFLTVLSSNLYITEATYHQSPLDIQLLDQVALSNFTDIRYISYQKGGMRAATLVLDDNVNLPQWTFDQLIIPRLGLTDSWNLNMSTNNEVNITLPGIRAVANCTLITPTFQNYTLSSKGILSQLDVKFDLPPCGNISEQAGTSNLTTISNANITESFAYWLDRDSKINHCPEHLVVAGNWNAQKNKLSLTNLHCMPYLETVQTAVRLDHPRLQINRNYTPAVNESTRQFLAAIEVPGIGQHLLSPYEDISSANIDSVDGFYQTMALQGQSLDTDLANPQGFKDTVEVTYTRVLAQVLNQNRIPMEQNKTVTGTLLEYNRTRLKQERGPAYALQALLSVMAICCAATFLLGRTKHVLPKNPRSIAAMASLLAGSHLLDNAIIPPGSEWLNDKESKERGLFEGLQFKNESSKRTKRTAAGIPTWSPTVVLICRSTAYVWQSGRDAQFSAD